MVLSTRSTYISEPTTTIDVIAGQYRSDEEQSQAPRGEPVSTTIHVSDAAVPEVRQQQYTSAALLKQ